MTGIRHEEMLELIHHSFITYTLFTTGGAVPMLQRIDPEPSCLVRQPHCVISVDMSCEGNPR